MLEHFLQLLHNHFVWNCILVAMVVLACISIPMQVKDRIKSNEEMYSTLRWRDLEYRHQLWLMLFSEDAAVKDEARAKVIAIAPSFPMKNPPRKKAEIGD